MIPAIFGWNGNHPAALVTFRAAEPVRSVCFGFDGFLRRFILRAVELCQSRLLQVSVQLWNRGL